MKHMLAHACKAWWVNPHQGRQTWACMARFPAFTVAYQALYEENVEEESLEGCNMSMLQKKPRRFAGNPASV